MPLINHSLNIDNSIGYPFGLQFKLNQVLKTGHKSQVKLLRSEDQNVFYGLFDANDVDFEIIVDNKSCDKNFGIELNFENKVLKKYYIRSGQKGVLNVLDSSGRKLHFNKSMNEHGEQLSSTNYEEEAINCSRIQFNVEVGKCAENQELMDFPTTGKWINIFIKFEGKAIPLTINSACTILNVVEMLRTKGEVINKTSDHYILILKGKPLMGDNTLDEFGVEDGSTLFVPRTITIGSTSRQLSEQTDQHFDILSQINDQEFEASKEFKIISFAIELKTKTIYSLE